MGCLALSHFHCLGVNTHPQLLSLQVQHPFLELGFYTVGTIKP